MQENRGNFADFSEDLSKRLIRIESLVKKARTNLDAEAKTRIREELTQIIRSGQINREFFVNKLLPLAGLTETERIYWQTKELHLDEMIDALTNPVERNVDVKEKGEKKPAPATGETKEKNLNYQKAQDFLQNLPAQEFTDKSIKDIYNDFLAQTALTEKDYSYLAFKNQSYNIREKRDIPIERRSFAKEVKEDLKTFITGLSDEELKLSSTKIHEMFLARHLYKKDDCTARMVIAQVKKERERREVKPDKLSIGPENDAILLAYLENLDEEKLADTEQAQSTYDRFLKDNQLTAEDIPYVLYLKRRSRIRKKRSIEVKDLISPAIVKKVAEYLTETQPEKLAKNEQRINWEEFLRVSNLEESDCKYEYFQSQVRKERKRRGVKPEQIAKASPRTLELLQDYLSKLSDLALKPGQTIKSDYLEFLKLHTLPEESLGFRRFRTELTKERRKRKK